MGEVTHQLTDEIHLAQPGTTAKRQVSGTDGQTALTTKTTADQPAPRQTGKFVLTYLLWFHPGKQAVTAFTNPDRETITAQLNAWYRDKYPELIAAKPKLLEDAITGVVAAYSDNVFPEMKVAWGTYTDHISHGPDFDIGCFRCHDDLHTSPDGKTISADCNTCHTLLALEEENPEILDQLRGQN